MPPGPLVGLRCAKAGRGCYTIGGMTSSHIRTTLPPHEQQTGRFAAATVLATAGAGDVLSGMITRAASRAVCSPVRGRRNKCNVAWQCRTRAALVPG